MTVWRRALLFRYAGRRIRWKTHWNAKEINKFRTYKANADLKTWGSKQ